MTAPPAMAVRGNDATRKRILRAAMELFGRDGFDATTVRAIAERCELTDPLLYYYFKSKRDVLTALWELPSPLEQLRPGPSKVRAGDPARPLDDAQLMELVDWMLDGSVRQDAINRILIRSILDGDATAMAVREAKRAHWLRVLTPYFLTAFPAEEAALRVEASIMLSLGLVYTAQIEHGSDFPRIAAEPAFRERMQQLTRMAVQLPPPAEN